MSADDQPQESERRQVTVLFADISGFTAMSEALDPEDVTATMNDCLGMMGSVALTSGKFACVSCVCLCFIGLADRNSEPHRSSAAKYTPWVPPAIRLFLAQNLMPSEILITARLL